MVYLAAKPSHGGRRGGVVDVDRLACSLHRPTVYSHQKGDQSFLTGAAPSHHTTVGSGAFPRDAKLPGLDI
jgi:hypothetical protein